MNCWISSELFGSSELIVGVFVKSGFLTDTMYWQSASTFLETQLRQGRPLSHFCFRAWQLVHDSTVRLLFLVAKDLSAVSSDIEVDNWRMAQDGLVEVDI